MFFWVALARGVRSKSKTLSPATMIRSSFGSASRMKNAMSPIEPRRFSTEVVPSDNIDTVGALVRLTDQSMNAGHPTSCVITETWSIDGTAPSRSTTKSSAVRDPIGSRCLGRPPVRVPRRVAQPAASTRACMLSMVRRHDPTVLRNQHILTFEMDVRKGGWRPFAGDGDVSS